MLSGTYFYGGWFWYAETAFGESIFGGTVEKEVLTKAVTVFIILIVFTILALLTIGVYLFNIEKGNWCMYLSKTIILFVAFFVLTLILSIVIIYTVHYRNPLSIDQHEWIVTHSGLSVTDQAVTDEIQRFDFDVYLYDPADLT
jgi:membrane protein YdbS with pleckstrin-like domain